MKGSNKGWVLACGILAVIIVVLVISIVWIVAERRAKVEAVKSNCHTVQLAVEDFAVLNDGEFPSDVVADKTPTGETVKDILPGRELLENPYTGKATEPVYGTAVNPGEVGYAPLVSNNGINVGYTITGVGKKAGVIIITLSTGQYKVL